MGFGCHLGFWAILGLLELLGWALVVGLSEERVKWSFTLGVGQINEIHSFGL